MARSIIVPSPSADVIKDKVTAVARFVGTRIAAELLPPPNGVQYGVVSTDGLTGDALAAAQAQNALMEAYFKRRATIFDTLKTRLNTDKQFQILRTMIVSGVPQGTPNLFATGNLPEIDNAATEFDIFDVIMSVGLDLYVGNTGENSPASIGVDPSTEWLAFWQNERDNGQPALEV